MIYWEAVTILLNIHEEGWWVCWGFFIIRGYRWDPIYMQKGRPWLANVIEVYFNLTLRKRSIPMSYMQRVTKDNKEVRRKAE